MADAAVPMLTRAERRRLIAWGLLRALAVAAALAVLYYRLPLDRLDGVPLGVALAVALLILLGVTIWQLRAIVRAAHPGVRGIEALALIVPLFLFLFAAIYFVMSHGDADSFSTETLTRTGALYFTVTVFATVGFGDITATGETAQLLVTVQMILDLVILGLGIRVIIGAVQRGRQRQAADPDTAAGDRS